jgi:hypothetical protein
MMRAGYERLHAFLTGSDLKEPTPRERTKALIEERRRKHQATRDLRDRLLQETNLELSISGRNLP